MRGKVDISIHAPREGGDSWERNGIGWMTISIHAPREGGDGFIVRIPDQIIMISIHAPREGGDFQCFDASAVSAGFQSTPPARGATFAGASSDGL